MRPPDLNVRFLLTDLDCRTTEDSGGDELYLWVLGFKVDADTLGPPPPDGHPLLPSLGVHVFEGPPHPWFLAGGRSVDAPARLAIPPAMGTRTFVLRPAELPLVGSFSGIAGVIALLWDNDAFTAVTREDAYRVFLGTFAPALSEELNGFLNGRYDHVLRRSADEGLAVPQRIERLEDAEARKRLIDAIRDALVPRIKQQVASVVGFSDILDPDEVLGAEVQIYLGDEIAGTHDFTLHFKDEGADYLAFGQATGEALPVPRRPDSGVIYALQGDGILRWYRHTGFTDGTFAWADHSGDEVHPTWRFARTFSGGDGIVYGIEDMRLDPVTGRRSGGDLMWSRHDGWEHGTPRWTDFRRVGTGWASFQHVFHVGGGIIYAVQENGDLLWYRHLGQDEGTFDWAPGSGKRVNTGWGFRHLFGGGSGVLYAIADRSRDPRTGQWTGGDLLWYRHDDWLGGGEGWSGPATAGTDWDAFRQVIGHGEGIIYAVEETALDPVTGRRSGGRLRWYRHDGHSDGRHRWAPGSGNVVGKSWNFAALFAA